MNLLELDKFKSQLLALKSEIEDIELISKSSTATVTLDQSSVGRLSRMDALQGQQMALESERRRKQQLLQILAALRRIESGEFGCCSHCGEEIAIGRLKINPAATRCVDCSE